MALHGLHVVLIEITDDDVTARLFNQRLLTKLRDRLLSSELAYFVPISPTHFRACLLISELAYKFQSLPTKFRACL